LPANPGIGDNILCANLSVRVTENRAMKYEPRPIDTSAFPLPPSLAGLLERLAENTHDVWAAARLSQGWTYGPARDDKAMKHPCLVPYDQLPESEKEYDRQAAAEALKVILTLGYRIVPPGQG
jgi:ryanodine receptor 2